MIFYCTNCWEEIKEVDKICPNCGIEISKLEDESFIQKLIRALEHPEPETPIRAAYVIANRKAKESLPYLMNKIKSEKDPFILKAFIEAVLKIDPRLKSEIRNILGETVPITLKKLMKN